MTLVGQLVAMTLVVGLLIGIGGFSSGELGWRPARLRGPAMKAVTAATAVLGLAALALVVRREHCDADGGLAINVARLLVATALGEEVLFRGVLFAVWSRTTATDTAVVVANCVFFGLWHVAGGFEDGTFSPASVLGPAIAGLWFLWTRCRFSSVVVAAVPHAAINVPTWLFTKCF